MRHHCVLNDKPADENVQADPLDVSSKAANVKSSEHSGSAASTDDSHAVAGNFERGDLVHDDKFQDHSEAGKLGNTPASNRQSNLSPLNSPLSTGGIDTLAVTCYGSWKTSEFPSLIIALEKAKTKSQHDDEPGTIEGIDGDTIVVLEHGGKEGKWRADYVLQWQGIKILLSNRWAEHESIPNLIVQIGSLALMTYGHHQVWNDCKRLLAGLGFALTRAVPSRVDPCIDIANIHVGELVKPFVAMHRVCRAKNWATYGNGNTPTGFCMGKGIHVRVYDKGHEVRNDSEKIAALTATRWGETPYTATRVEFQVRGKDLRRLFSIETIDDLFAKIGSVCEWLTTEWFRLTDGEPDRKHGHEKRAAIHPHWQRVVDMFKAWTSDSHGPVARKPERCPQKKTLLIQAIGCLTSLAATEGATFHQVEDAIKYFVEQISTIISDDIGDKVWAKQLFWQSLGPGRGLKWSDDIPF